MFEKSIFVAACNQINRKKAEPNNTKEYYESYLKRKKYKTVQAIKNNCFSTKNYRKSKHC